MEAPWARAGQAGERRCREGGPWVVFRALVSSLTSARDSDLFIDVMLLNCGAGDDSGESLGLQGDPASPS